MGLIQTLRCRYGYHVRARSKVVRGKDGLLRSRCRSCGRAMVKNPETGRWAIAEEAPVQTLIGSG
jgi:ribosomal protein L37AE/L43A